MGSHAKHWQPAKRRSRDSSERIAIYTSLLLAPPAAAAAVAAAADHIEPGEFAIEQAPALVDELG